MCQKVVGGISLLLGLLGIVTLAFGAMAGGGVPPQLEKLMGNNADKFKGAAGGPILGLGALILVTAILGCATAKFKNPCFAIPFGLMTFVFGLILLILGGIAMVIGSPAATQAMRQGVCNGQASSPAVKFDTEYRNMIVKPMCSEICPCDADMFDAWSKTQDDATLRKSQRTLKYKGSEQSFANSKGIGANMVLLKAATKGQVGYKDFMTCYNKVLADQKPTTKNNGQKMKEWFKTNGADGLSKLEKEFECAGACQTQLFYITRPFNEQPERICFDALAKKIGGAARTVGTVCIITALVAFCAFCGSFPLCTAFNDEEGEGAKSAER